jgi:hypothetical protein
LDKGTPVPIAQVRVVFEQLGHAVAAAHQAGIVHRDLKPENIFLAESQRTGSPFVVKVLDFGIAKFLQDSPTKLTQGVGTPFWMAPEQIDDHGRVTPATDVWALGLIAFSLLTARCYWKSLQAPENTIARFYREVSVDPIVPASVRARELGCLVTLPAGFDAWFARCVARDPGERFPDAGLCLAAVMPVLAQTEGTGALTSVAAPPWHPPPAASPSVPSHAPGAQYAGPNARTWVPQPSEQVTRAVAPWPPPSAPPGWASPVASPQVRGRGTLWFALIAAVVFIGGGGVCVRVLVRASNVVPAQAAEPVRHEAPTLPVGGGPGLVPLPPPRVTGPLRAESVVTLDGRLSSPLVQRFARTQEPWVERCYAQALQLHPNLLGRVVVRVMGVPPSTVTVDSPDADESAFGTCVRQHFRTNLASVPAGAEPFIATYSAISPR